MRMRPLINQVKILIEGADISFSIISEVYQDKMYLLLAFFSILTFSSFQTLADPFILDLMMHHNIPKTSSLAAQTTSDCLGGLNGMDCAVPGNLEDPNKGAPA